MKLSRHFYIAILGLCLHLPHLKAQNNTLLSLQQCIIYAQQNNVQIKQLQLNTQSTLLDVTQSKEARLPSVNGSYSHGFSFGKNIDPTTNDYNSQTIQSSQWAINSNVILYQGGQKKGTITLKQLQNELAQLNLQQANNNIQLSILQAYLQILLANEQLKILKNQQQQTDNQYTRLQKLVAAGSIPEGSLLDVEAQKANDALNMVNAENGITLAYQQLSQVLDYYEPFTIESPTIPTPTISQTNTLNIEDLVQQALATRPDLKIIDKQLQISNKSLQLAKSAKLPVVSLSANINTNYSNLAKTLQLASGFDTTLTNYFTQNYELIYSLTPNYSLKKTGYIKQLSDNLGGFLGININVPIYNNGQVKRSIQQAKLAIENNQLSKLAAQNNLRNDLQQAILNAKAAYKEYEAAIITINALQKSLNFIDKKLQAGLGTNLDYITAKNNLTTAELTAQVAKYKWYFRLKIIDFYVGKPIY